MRPARPAGAPYMQEAGRGPALQAWPAGHSARRAGGPYSCSWRTLPIVAMAASILSSSTWAKESRIVLAPLPST
jgi:hypothetical protein